MVKVLNWQKLGNCWVSIFFWLKSLCFGLLLISNGSAAIMLDQIVAKVENEIITLSELNKMVKLVTNNLIQQEIELPEPKQLRQQVLEKMIMDQLQLQMAKRYGIEADSSTVNQELLELAKAQKITVAEYKQKVQQSGMAIEDFMEQLKNSITLRRLHQREIINDLQVSTADLENYLNIFKAEKINNGVQYHLGHILLTAPEKPSAELLSEIKQTITKLIQELKKGKDFKQLAASYSQGMQALEGGDLGWREIHKIPSIFVKEVQKMQVGEVAGPIESPSGFHIIKLQGKRHGQTSPADQELALRQIFLKIGDRFNDQQAKAMLLKLKAEIAKGKDFAELATKHSEEAKTAAKGGELGWIRQDQVIPTFWQAVINLPIGKISEPFKTELGWHLVQVINKRDPHNSPAALKRQALEDLKEQKFNEVLEIWLKKLRSQANIEILL